MSELSEPLSRPRRPGRPSRRAAGVDPAGAVVLVTGATSGIGAAAASRLLDRGARVVATGRDPVALTELAARGATPAALDLADPAAPRRAVAAALEAHGRLDAVVAAAGVGHEGPLASMDDERVARLVDVDLRAPLLLAAAALPALLARPRASLVLVTSIAGAVGVPGETVYSAAKAGLAAFAATAREELRGTGVAVSEVVPGVVDTPFFARRGAPYARRAPRPVSADRVARVVVDAVEQGWARRTVPGWLALPAALAGAAPGPYRVLARTLDPER